MQIVLFITVSYHMPIYIPDELIFKWYFSNYTVRVFYLTVVLGKKQFFYLNIFDGRFLSGNSENWIAEGVEVCSFFVDLLDLGHGDVRARCWYVGSATGGVLILWLSS